MTNGSGAHARPAKKRAANAATKKKKQVGRAAKILTTKLRRATTNGG
jgi:hypothetical protein